MPPSHNCCCVVLVFVIIVVVSTANIINRAEVVNLSLAGVANFTVVNVADDEAVAVSVILPMLQKFAKHCPLFESNQLAVFWSLLLSPILST